MPKPRKIVTHVTITQPWPTADDGHYLAMADARRIATARVDTAIAAASGRPVPLHGDTLPPDTAWEIA